MAIYVLDGVDKGIDVLGCYVSIKNNSGSVVYASPESDLNPEANKVIPIMSGESVVVRDCNKKVYVRGIGQIAIVDSNEPFNFFRPARIENSGSGESGITQQHLDNTLKLYATNAKVDEGLKNKVDFIEGMSLSTNNYTNEDKQTLSDLNDDVIALQHQMPTSINGDFTGKIENGVATINFRKVKMAALPYSDAWQKIAGIELTRESGSTAGAVILADRIYPETYDNHRENSLLNLGLRVYGDLTLHLDLSWNMVGSTVNLSDFVLAYKEDAGKFLVDFWVRGHTVWVYDMFVFLSEFYVNSNGWILYTPTHTNYRETLPEGYTVFESILAPTQANIPAIDKKIADLQKQIDNLR